jgi:hypothetical protein
MLSVHFVLDINCDLRRQKKIGKDINLPNISWMFIAVCIESPVVQIGQRRYSVQGGHLGGELLHPEVVLLLVEESCLLFPVVGAVLVGG